MSSNFSTLERTISHGVVQHHIPSGDEPIFPQLTEAGPHTDAFQQETNTGLVLASEVEPHSGAGSPTSTLVHSPKDPEKGGFDAKLVTFTEGDPSNPRNFSKTKKWTATMLATLLCFDSGFASSIITGGLTPMRQQFNVSVDIINLSVCFFVVGFGVGPLFFAPLSEMYGRRVIYLISMAFFFIFTIPCAVAQNVETLIVCRFLAGLGASAPMTNAGGTIGDVWAVNERGNKMAAFSSILFASPCLGPLVGGYISESVSWRWIYWVLLIFSGVCWLIAFAFLPETYAPTILRWRAEQLRKETGDDTIQTEQERQRRSAADIAKQSLLRPLQMLFTEPIMICFSGYLCLIYGLLYAFFFAYPIIFEEGHGFTAGQVGLTFLSILVGIVLVGAFACPLQERYYQRKIREGGGSTVPESRLPLMMICSLLLPISLFIFAWTSNPNTHWAGALVSGIPFGFALVGIYISANNYLVDVYLRYGASAMAAKTFIRSLAGASASQWVFLMYRRLGNEWAGSLLAFLAVGMAPIPFIFYLKGAGIRTRSPMAN